MTYDTIWFNRVFDCQFPAELFPVMIERLRGTLVRLEHKINGLSDSVLISKLNGWTIKEHVGHLYDLEDLWLKRVKNFKAQEKELFPADLNNTRTKEANHNQTPIHTLLDQFNQSRQQLIVQLESFELNEVEQTALHPRLKKPMWVIDLAHFVAEHDDHHLTKIHDIVQQPI